MNWLKSVVEELWGLFVDDGLLAILTIVWLAFVGWALPALVPALTVSPWRGAVLLTGLSVILVESVTRAARRAARDRKSEA